MGLLKLLFFVFLISFPIAEIGKVQLDNGVSISINDVFLLLLVSAWIFFKIRYKKQKKYFLQKPILIFVSICLITLILNFYNLTLEMFLISLLYLVRFASYVSLYFIIKEFDLNTKNKISFFLLFSGFITVLIGYIQYFFYPSLGNLFYLGWDEHLYRMFSSFLDPNFAGVFFVLYFIFSLIFVKEYFVKRIIYKLISVSFISILTLIAVYLTYSRSALVMLFVGIITFLILSKKGKLVFIAVSILTLMIFMSPKSFKTEGTNLLRTVSSEARIVSIKQGFYIFEKNPVFGVGFNAYRYAQNKYLGLNNIYWKTTHSGAGTDNSFVFVLATTGIVGFIAYIYFLYNIFYLSKFNLVKSKYAVVLFSSLLGLLASSFFINSFFYVFILEWVFILAGLTENN
ncbi:MAG: O-antigen ligase family protein [Patescibacteria group bacterium]